ncbi:TVP38/TMEM64 family membrane protein slr0305-like protein [Drosera capensis]
MPTLSLTVFTPLCLSLSSPSSSSSTPLHHHPQFHPKPFTVSCCSSLKQSNKQHQPHQRKIQDPTFSGTPQILLNQNPKGEFDEPESPNNGGDDDDEKEENGEAGLGLGLGLGGDGDDGGGAVKGTILAGVLLVGVVGGFGALGYAYRDQLNEFLTQFSRVIEGYGLAGYALFVAVYAGLEVLAIPAIPLTMSAGLLFGSFTGTIIVSISGTLAASIAFLIARYLARDRILKMVEGNKKFLAIDKAIGENGFRVVTLLRLSPLLPFSLGNYLYGLTSVEFAPYVLGSWLGMLPGTWAYVSAGAFGRTIIQEESEVGLPGGPGQLLTLGLGLLATVLAASYVTKLAKDAVKDIE